MLKHFMKFTDLIKRTTLLFITVALFFTSFSPIEKSITEIESIQGENLLATTYSTLLVEGEVIDEIMTGETNTFVLTSHHRVFSWGSNSNGLIGNNNASIVVSIPTDITSAFGLQEGDYITSIDYDLYSVIALSSSGRVFTWGSNSIGQLGDNTLVQKNSPVDITSNFSLTNGDKIVKVQMGSNYGLALSQNGKLFSWGNNIEGQLGNNSKVSSRLPLEINAYFTLPSGDAIIQIETAQLHSGFLTRNGLVYIWGTSDYSVTGKVNGTNDVLVPSVLNTKFPLSSLDGDKIIKIKVNYQHTLFLTQNGRILVLGANNTGLASSGSTGADITVPLDITGNVAFTSTERFSDVYAGKYHFGATTTTGTVYLWGLNTSGQLGDALATGTYAEDAIAFSNSRISNANPVKIFMGGKQTYMTADNGQLYGFGSNANTLIANATQTFIAQPLSIGLLKELYLTNIIFNTNGGSQVETITQESGTSFGTRPTTTKPGYDFAGWYSDEGLTSNFGSSPYILGVNDINLYAKWSLKTYSISYVLNSGTNSVSNPTTYTYEQSVTLQEPTRTGYTFMGWYISSSFSGTAVTSIPLGSTFTKTFYAKWVLTNYTLDYQLNGGTNSSTNPLSFTKISATITLKAPIRAGYTFGGWYTTSNFSGTAILTIPLGSMGDKLIYAKWIENIYNIGYVLNGGTNSISNPATYSEVPISSSTVNLQSPTRAGYTFMGWYTTSNLTGSPVTSIPAGSIGNKTFWAKWEINSLTLSFNSNGGSTVSSIVKNAGVLITAPTNPTKTGYTFGGWYTESSLTNAFTFTATTKMPTSNTILYAKWTPTSYSIIYNIGQGVQNNLNPTSYTINDAIVLYNPTKVGYTFDGWYVGWYFDSNADAVNSGYNTGVTGNLEFHAHWTLNSYTISFQTDNSTTIPSITQTFGTAITAPENPIRTGFVFNGWLLNDGSATDFTFTTMPAVNVNLVAKWTPIVYPINLYNIENSTVVNSPTVTQDISYTMAHSAPLYNRLKTGYTFKGWYTDATFSGTAITEIPSGSTGLKNVYAKWEANPYTLTLVVDGSTVSTITQNYASAITAPSAPDVSGKRFLGWFLTLTDTTSYAFTTMPANSFTLYGKYTYIQTSEIDFNSNFGSIVSTIVQEIGSTVSAPTAPTRTGYTFAGWYSDSQLTSAYTFTTMPSSSITLYAKWTARTYVVTFEVDLNTKPTNTFSYMDVIVPISTPYKTNMLFVGWFLNDTFTAPINFSTYRVTGAITLYAKFVDNYSIDWKYNGGVDSSSSPVYSSNFTPGNILLNSQKPQLPTKYGHDLGGWYSDAALTTEVNLSTVVLQAQDYSFYAKWTPKTYTVTFNTNGGSAVSDQTVAYGSLVTGPTPPTKTGYTFVAWSKNNSIIDAWDFTQYSVTGATPLYAFYKPSLYNVNVYWYNQSTYLSVKRYTYGASLSGFVYPLAPLRNGYVFDHWEWVGGAQPSTMPAAHLSVYSVYTPLNYTLSFNSNGGSSISDATYGYGSSVSQPSSSPTKAGYGFSGWYEDSALSTPYTFSTMPASNVTVYAKWTQVPYSINYELNEGINNALNPSGYFISDGLITLENPTRWKYTFLGWFSDSSFTTSSSTIASGSSDTKTFYAKWEPTNFAVTYELNGGSISGSNPTSVNIASSTVALISPTKDGYTFDGWYNNSNFSGTKYTNFSAWYTDRTYYAKWNATVYTISYVLAGGTNPSANLTSYIITTQDFTLLEPTKNGYTFVAWKDENATSQTTLPMGSYGNKTYTATWTPTSYAISYQLNGGSLSSSTSTYTIESNSISLGQASKTGSSFDGWFDNENFGGTSITSLAQGSIGDKTYYAKWTEVQNTISYHLNSGTNHVNNPSSYTVSSPTITLLDPSRSGYTFGGWFDNANYTGSAITSIDSGGTSNKTFYAQWSIIEYSIDYELNGGTNSSGNPNNYWVNSDEVILLTPTKSGYTFEGWFINSDFSGTQSTSIVTGSTGNIQYSAKWSENNYTINYHLNEGNNSTNNLTQYTYVSPDITLEPATRLGYTFEGWYDNALWSGTEITHIPSMSFGNKDYYAKWVVTQFNILFEENGGSSVATLSSPYLASITPPSAPTKTGYSFGGWYTDTNFSTAYTFSTMPAADIRLYALWTINTYTLNFVSNGGRVLESLNALYGSLLTAPLNPFYEGYQFMGWYSDAGLTTAYTFGNMPANNVSIYAKWAPISYSVNYVLEGGINHSSNISSYTASTSTFTYLSPSKFGYDFAGWYTSNAYTTYVTQLNASELQNITIYAKWTPKSYTISFEENGGSSIINQQVYYLDKVQKPVTPIQTNKVFKGWYTDAALSLPYNFVDTQISSDLTLYARWADVYVFDFESNEGSYVQGQNITMGTQATRPSNPSKVGYSFVNWYRDLSLTEVFDFTQNISSNTLVYAKWAPQTYLFTYQAEDEVLFTSTETFGQLISDPGTPFKEGFSFIGWSTSATSYQEWQLSRQLVDGARTLYAHWGIQQFDVTFRDTDGRILSNQRVDFDGSASIPIPPTRLGYRFAQWDNTFTNVTQSIIVQPVYTAIPVQVINLDSLISASVSNVFESIPFTDDELSLEIEIKIEIDVLDRVDVNSSDQMTMDAYVNTRLFEGSTTTTYIGISVQTIINDEVTELSQLEDDLTIQFALPEVYRNKDFEIVRVHNGVATNIPYVYNSFTHIVSFESSQFSTYGISTSVVQSPVINLIPVVTVQEIVQEALLVDETETIIPEPTPIEEPTKPEENPSKPSEEVETVSSLGWIMGGIGVTGFSLFIFFILFKRRKKEEEELDEA